MRPSLRSPTRLRYLALAAVLAALHAPAFATVYKCTSPDGRVTFRDTPCDRATDAMERVPVPEYTPPPVQMAPEAPQTVEAPAPETLPAPKPPTQIIHIDAAELPPAGDSAGGTGAYIPPPLPETKHAPARTVLPAAAFPRPAMRSTYPSKPLATDSTTLANARRALDMLDGDAPEPPKKAKPKRKRLFGLFSRKEQ